MKPFQANFSFVNRKIQRTTSKAGRVDIQSVAKYRVSEIDVHKDGLLPYKVKTSAGRFGFCGQTYSYNVFKTCRYVFILCFVSEEQILEELIEKAGRLEFNLLHICHFFFGDSGYTIGKCGV
jgi:hypothetical protein